MIYAASNGLITAIQNGATSGTAIQDPCKAALFMFQNLKATFDVSDPDNIAMLDGLVAARVISDTNKVAILALGIVPVSQSVAQFGSNLSEDDINRAN